jgi:hypothetical protein
MLRGISGGQKKRYVLSLAKLPQHRWCLHAISVLSIFVSSTPACSLQADHWRDAGQPVQGHLR